MMSQMTLPRSKNLPLLGERSGGRTAGDFVKGQLDQVAAESKDRAEEVSGNPRPSIPAFMANVPDGGGDNVIPLSFKPEVYGRTSVNTLTRWNGYVESIDDTHFVAVVYDATRNSGEREEARIPRRLLKPSEVEFLKPGARLQLVVGLSKAPAGNRIKETIVYFRRYVENQPSIADELLPLLERLRGESAG